ncbi:MAG: DUF1674 domain-containing protein [Alphaproteobacteria bacterium]
MTKHVKKETEKNTERPENEGNAKADTKEIGGFEDQNLPEPTRYGDWEVKGRCSDF